MKALFDAAAALRKAINRSKRWEFTGTLEAPKVILYQRNFIGFAYGLFKVQKLIG